MTGQSVGVHLAALVSLYPGPFFSSSEWQL